MADIEKLNTIDVAAFLRDIAGKAMTREPVTFDATWRSREVQARLYRTADLWERIAKGEIELVVRHG